MAQPLTLPERPEDQTPATAPPLPTPGEPAGLPARRGQFTILRAHAQGGLGQVSLAHDEKLHRQVALKEIRPDRLDEPELHRRFLIEAEVTGQLEHPGIVPVYALDSEGG